MKEGAGAEPEWAKEAWPNHSIYLPRRRFPATLFGYFEHPPKVNYYLHKCTQDQGDAGHTPDASREPKNASACATFWASSFHFYRP